MRHRLRFSTARNALLWALGSFGCLQLALAVVIEEALPELRDPFYSLKAARLQRQIHLLGPEGKVVVLLGSSRAADALEGSRFDADLDGETSQPVLVFNLGIPGSGPMAELLYFERLLTAGVRPDLLLIEVLPPLLDRKAGLECKWFPADRLGPTDLAVLSEHGLPMHHLRRCWREGCACPWYTHRFTLVSAVAPTILPGDLRQNWPRRCDDFGTVPRPAGEFPANYRRQALDHARLEYQPTLHDFHLGGPPCLALRQLLEKCRQTGVPAALMLLPEGSEFQRWYPPAAWEQVRAFLQELSDSYGTPIVNCRDWIGDADFMDSHHLLVLGARAFTARLHREVIVPFLRNRPARQQEARR